MSTRAVLVTGANGFVGRAVCRRLLRDDWTVVGAIRDERATASLPAGVAPVIMGEVQSADWSAGLGAVDAVVHLVARTHVLRDTAADAAAAYRSVNVEGTRNLLAACAAAGIRRFVYMSSVKAAGEASEVPYREADRPRPLDEYGRTKLEAEALVRTASKVTSMQTVVLRPPLVYGPGVRGNFIRLLRLVSRGVPLPLGSVKNRRDMIFVENLADAVRAALEHPAATGETFYVADDETLSTPELVDRIALLLGLRPRLLPVPVRLLRWAGRITGRGPEVERLTGSLTVSTEQIRRTLGWSPPVPIDRGLRETVEWFSAAHISKSAGGAGRGASGAEAENQVQFRR